MYVLKLTVLGNHGPFAPAGNHATSGYLYEENGVKIVLDLGAGTLTRLLAATDIGDIDAIYISHLHFDHTSDLLTLGYMPLKNKIRVLVHKTDSEYCRILFSSPVFDVVCIDENSCLNIGGLELSFFRMVHPETDHAIMIKGEKNFVYTGDTIMNDRLAELAANTDIMLADCTKPVDFNGPHMRFADAEILTKANPSLKIIATHIGAGDEIPEDFRYSDRISVCRETESYIY